MRNGIYNKDIHEENRAPIFLQWLDCIHQLLTQFKSAFEFNNEFLLFLAYHTNSYLYGTFLFNSDKVFNIFNKGKNRKKCEDEDNFNLE